MDTIAAVCIGIALAAASGFRIFVPMLVLSIATRNGLLPIELAENWQWIGSSWASVAFGAATVVEVGAYYIPWLDNLLDSIATPAATLAGVLVSAAVVSDLPPLVQWTVAIVGGGGSAAIVQGGTVLTRALSTGTTGGLGNPVVSTGEAAGSTGLSILAVVVPLLAGLLVLGIGAWLVSRWLRRRRNRRTASPPVATA